MKSGFIYPVVKFTLEKLKFFNLVELFKFIARQFNFQPNNIERPKELNRIGTDIFIISKWVFLISIWKTHQTNSFITFTIWYFIVTNVYTYLYHHIWCDESLKTDDFSKDRIRRRFVHLSLAVAFSTYCFAYLYQMPYSSDIDWGIKYPASLYSTMFSFSNSLAANYGDIKPKTDIGNIISNIQLLITFVFATIIISRSIPQTNSPN